MKRLLLLLLLHLLFQYRGNAQENAPSLSLERAIALALENNLLLRQNNLQLEAARLDYRQSVNDMLPIVNAGINHGLNQGRSIDPSTNTYVDEEIKYGTYGVEGSLLLFRGFGMHHSLRQARHGQEAARLELQQARETLTLNVMLAYLQVLTREDLVVVARQQVAVSRQQLQRLEQLQEQGAINPPLLAEMAGQLKGEELALLNARQLLEVSKLALAQQMNQPYHSAMQLERLDLEAPVPGEQTQATAAEVYTSALGQLALVKAARLRTKSAEAGVRAVRSGLYPSLLLNGNLNSNYSSAARINGERIYYNDQLRNNLFSHVGISLRMPILNSFSTHNRLRRAKLEVQEQLIAEEGVRMQLRQQVEQARLDLSNAYERYQLLREQAGAYTEAFRAAEIRFNAGAGSIVDYLLAKNNLDRARTNLLMQQYDYVLRQKILEFYAGR